MEALLLNPTPTHWIVVGKWLAAATLASIGAWFSLGLCVAILDYVPLHELGLRDRRFGWNVEMQIRAFQHDLNWVEDTFGQLLHTWSIITRAKDSLADENLLGEVVGQAAITGRSGPDAASESAAAARA